MLELAIISALLGAALAARFKVLAVVAAIPVALLVATAAGVTSGRSSWWIASAMAVTAASMEFGYVVGGVLWLAHSPDPRRRLESSERQKMVG
jgi:hypothetical protein